MILYRVIVLSVQVYVCLDVCIYMCACVQCVRGYELAQCCASGASDINTRGLQHEGTLNLIQVREDFI